MNSIINRTKELKILDKIMQSHEPQFMAVYGRRRIGKTFLIREYFKTKGIYLELTGVRNAKMAAQLQNFAESISNTFKKGEPIDSFSSWQQGFSVLKKQIELNFKPIPKNNQKLIIFFDELPWLAGDKSDFLDHLDHFWNSYLSQFKNVILIICGSAASWMINRVISDKGGMHGRLTCLLKMLPFDLNENKIFLKSRGVNLDDQQLAELYLCLGGVAKYLTFVEPGLSAAQNINQICFTQNAYLQNEFNNLYHSLFHNAHRHIKIVRVLSEVRKGISRTELLKKAELSSGGVSAQILEELEESGFIAYTPDWMAAKNKGRYRLIDEFSLFYLYWMDQLSINQFAQTDPDYWLKMKNTASWKSWSGFSFETLCIKHIYAIKKSLGISGILTHELSWQHIASNQAEKGTQIDLIIDRDDRCITILEVKFSDHPFVLTQEYAQKLKQKVAIFKEQTKTAKTIFLCLISPHGLKNSETNVGLFQQQLTLKDLLQ